MNEPIEFKPGTFYSLEWLENQLAGTVSLQQFLHVLNLQCTGRTRMFQNGLFGDEILQAIQSHLKTNKAPENTVSGISGATTAPVLPRKRGRPRKFEPITSEEVNGGTKRPDPPKK